MFTKIQGKWVTKFKVLELIYFLNTLYYSYTKDGFTTKVLKTYMITMFIPSTYIHTFYV